MFFKKYFLVLVLSFIAMGMIVFKLNYKPEINEIENIQTIKNEETIEPTVVVEINKESTDEAKIKENIKIFPYIGVNFDISESSESGVLVVKNKSESKEETIKEMLNFFDVNKLDINSYKFIYKN